MNYKKWTIITLTITLVLLILIASVMITIDSLFQYHKPIETIAYQINSQDYQNPGMAKNFEYDSVLLGTSMIENFQVSWFKDNMDLNVLKVPYSGGSPKNMQKIMQIIEKQNKDLKAVFLGYDLFTQTVDINQLRHELPEYLYDDKIYNDVQYWFNKDLIYRTYKDIQNTQLGNKMTTLDMAYNWNKNYNYTETETIKEYSINTRNTKIVYDTNLINTKQNMEQNIKPMIENNPNTQFYIFYPPYSILYWHKIIEDGKVDAVFEQLEYSMQEFLKYDNVKLFYFQDIEEIITNLYLYRDYSHYKQDINDYMSECFKEGNYVVTKENYKEEIQNMKQFIQNFDYDIYWGSKAILKRETNAVVYLELLNNENYITVIEGNIKNAILKDTNVMQKLQQLGIQYKFQEKNRYYTAIINGKEVYEKVDENEFIDTNTIENHQIEVTTIGNENEYSHIKIDKIEYSKQKDDINIVVYDKKLNRVIDSIHFNLRDVKVIR